MAIQVPVVARHYNANEYEREGRNGRLYRGILGWRWYLSLHGMPAGDPEGYKTRREAIAEGKILARAMPTNQPHGA